MTLASAEGTVDGDATTADPERRLRASVLRPLALLMALIVPAAGTWALTSTPESSLAVFDRPPTAVEAEMEAAVKAEGFIDGPEAAVARLVLEIPSESREFDQRIWAVKSAGLGYTTERMELGEVVCLAIQTAPDVSLGFLSCMDEETIERRGFVPTDSPRPTAFVDGDVRVIIWGPSGPARLAEPPAPSSSPGEPRESIESGGRR